MLPSHPVPRYSILALMFNKLIDEGRSVSIDEVRRRIEDGSLFDWLAATYEDAPFYLAQYRVTRPHHRCPRGPRATA